MLILLRNITIIYHLAIAVVVGVDELPTFRLIRLMIIGVAGYLGVPVPIAPHLKLRLLLLLSLSANIKFPAEITVGIIIIMHIRNIHRAVISGVDHQRNTRNTLPLECVLLLFEGIPTLISRCNLRRLVPLPLLKSLRPSRQLPRLISHAKSFNGLLKWVAGVVQYLPNLIKILKFIILNLHGGLFLRPLLLSVIPIPNLCLNLLTFIV